MLRNNLKKIKMLQSQLYFHRVPGKTHKYRRVICPSCYSKWTEPIYCEKTNCLNCKCSLRLYEIFSQRRILYEDEEIRSGDEWEIEIAFHTGRCYVPYRTNNRLNCEKKINLEYNTPKFECPVFGWDHTTGEEYGRPPENWFKKRFETT